MEERLRGHKFIRTGLVIVGLTGLLCVPGSASAAKPKLSIDNAGDTPEPAASGDPFTQAKFKVTLSKRAKKTAKASYSTTDVSTEGADDYVAVDSGEVRIAKGKRRATIAISIRGDDLVEDPETFKVVLADPKNATLDTAEGVGTLLDTEDPALDSLIIPECLNVAAIGQGTVELSGPAPADTQVSLEAIHPNGLIVPSTATVLQGNTSATFSLAATAGGANGVTATLGDVVITKLMFIRPQNEPCGR